MASYGILWPSHEIHCHFYVRRATGGERCPKPPSVQGLVAVKLLTRRKTSCMDQIATGFFCSSVTELTLKCPRTVPNLDPAELTKRAQPGARTLEDPCHLWVQLQDRVQGRIEPLGNTLQVHALAPYPFLAPYLKLYPDCCISYLICMNHSCFTCADRVDGALASRKTDMPHMWLCFYDLMILPYYCIQMLYPDASSYL
jgi:hypothetical protein